MGWVFPGNVRYISIYRIWVNNKQVRCSTIQPLMFMLFYQKHEVFLCTHLVLTWVFNRGLQVQLLSKVRPKWPRYRPHMARRSLLRVPPACIQFQLHLASFEIRDFFFRFQNCLLLWRLVGLPKKSHGFWTRKHRPFHVHSPHLLIHRTWRQQNGHFGQWSWCSTRRISKGTWPEKG